MIDSHHSSMAEKLKAYVDQFQENEWANFLIPRIDLTNSRDLNISILLSSNIKKEPLKSVVTFLKKNFSDKYPKAVESLVVKVNATKVDLAGLIISFVQLSQPHTCLICNSDYLPYSNNDSTDVGSEANVKCFICKTPSHDTCVNETVVSEHQGIVFLCYNCIERKKANEQDIPQPNTIPHPTNGSDSSLSSDETSGSDSSHKKSLI